MKVYAENLLALSQLANAQERLREHAEHVAELMSDGLDFYDLGAEERGAAGDDDKYSAWLYTWFPPDSWLADKDEMTYKKECAA